MATVAASEKAVGDGAVSDRAVSDPAVVCCFVRVLVGALSKVLEAICEGTSRKTLRLDTGSLKGDKLLISS